MTDTWSNQKTSEGSQQDVRGHWFWNRVRPIPNLRYIQDFLLQCTASYHVTFQETSLRNHVVSSLKSMLLQMPCFVVFALFFFRLFFMLSFVFRFGVILWEGRIWFWVFRCRFSVCGRGWEFSLTYAVSAQNKRCTILSCSSTSVLSFDVLLTVLNH